MPPHAHIQLIDSLIDSLLGEEFYAKSIPEAQRDVEKAGLVAVPMYLLAKEFPHKEFYTANTADFSGIDTKGRYTKKGGSVVITVHGGLDGWAFPPARLEQALQKWKDSGKKLGTGVNQVYATILEQQDIDNMLQGIMLDGKESPVKAYEDFEGVSKDMKRQAIVRPLELAQQTESGYDEIIRLCDKSGNVTDSQMIIYAGSKEAAQEIINSVQGQPYNRRKLGVWHPFNQDTFNPEQAQGRVSVLVSGNINGFSGSGNVYDYACVVGVAPEALVGKNFSTSKENVPETKTPELTPSSTRRDCSSKS